MQSAPALSHPAAQQYFQRIQQALTQQPDGSWFGREEHQKLCYHFCAQGAVIASDLVKVLEQSSNLMMRSEALRVAALANLRPQILPSLEKMLERASYRPIFELKLRMLRQMWTQSASSKLSEIDQYIQNLEQYLWFGLPGQSLQAIQTNLPIIAGHGEAGLFALDQLLGRILDEGYLMAFDHLSLFHHAAELYVERRYFEGVQTFFDFLADCGPVSPQKEDLSTIGAVLKAVRKLRPYRYPQWSMPLARFVEHFRAIKQQGRAMEANMLIILITASSLEEALLLDDDELVDLLRGRRDFAYTEHELEEVARLCDAVLQSGRNDARMYHIRGWLAARLEGPDSAEGYYQKAVSIRPGYVYPHLALAAIYDQRGEEAARDQHLASACQANPSQISCHRRYGELLRQQDRIQEALQIHQRGTQIRPEQITILELEEYFGCLVSMAQIYLEQGNKSQALAVLNNVDRPSLESTFTARFSTRNRAIFDLLFKGLRDFRAEVQRAA